MRRIFARWKIITEKISDLQIKVLFSIIYFFLLTPVGFIMSYFFDFLNIKGKKSNWSNVQSRSTALNDLKLQ